MIPIIRDAFTRLPGFLEEHRQVIDEVVKHLVTFRYLDLEDLGADSLDNALHRLCEHAGIDSTGIDRLIRIYRFIRRNPRCQVCESLEAAPEAVQSRWTKKQLTFYVDGTVRSIPRQQFRTAIADYFKNWEAVCDLKFTEIDNSNSDILVSTGRGSSSQFDGPNGTLAWSYLPNGDDRQILMKFDDDETFTTDPTGRGVYLEAVSTHEFGHAIGISHAPNATSLMSPYYNKSISTPRAWDISQAQTRYGAPKSAPTPPPATPPVQPEPAPPAVPVIPPGYVKVSDIIIPGHRII